MVPTVERGLREADFWSMEMAGERPSMKSTSGLSIWPRNCRSQGSSRLTFLRLCSRAPRTTSVSDMSGSDAPHGSTVRRPSPATTSKSGRSKVSTRPPRRSAQATTAASATPSRRSAYRARSARMRDVSSSPQSRVSSPASNDARTRSRATSPSRRPITKPSSLRIAAGTTSGPRSPSTTATARRWCGSLRLASTKMPEVSRVINPGPTPARSTPRRRHRSAPRPRRRQCSPAWGGAPDRGSAGGPPGCCRPATALPAWPGSGPRPGDRAGGTTSSSPSRHPTAIYGIWHRSARLPELPLEVGDLVPQAGGVLEAQVGGRLVHLLLQRLDQPAELVVGHLQELLAAGLLPGRPPAAALGRDGRLVGAAPDHLQDVGHLLADGGGVDAVLGVVGGLEAPAPLGLGDGLPHGVGHLVGVHHDLAADVAGRPPHRLDQRRLGAQEALLVGVEDG